MPYFGAANAQGDTGIFRRNFDGELDEARTTAAALSPSQFLTGSAAAPEPGTLALLWLGLPLAGVAMRRKY